MKSLSKVITIILFAGVLIAGCSQQPTAAATSPDSDAAIANTMAAMQTQIADSSANASQPAATEAVSTPTAEPTLIPTATEAPTLEPTATLLPTVAAPVQQSGSEASSGPSYRVGDVQDLNYPDGTYVDVNLDFTKIWKIKNIGTGTWPADTKVVFTDSNLLNAGSYTIGQVVSPGQYVTIRLDLKAPETVGKYKGKFMLELPDGTRFGIGSNFDQPFWVYIYTH